MSFAWTNAVWENSKSSGTSRVIMLALADHADDNGICWPSISRLARYANVDRRNIFRHLEALIKAGEIKISGKGFRGVNKYQITLPTGGNIATGGESVTGDETATCTSGDTVMGTGDETATQTINEPSLNLQSCSKHRSVDDEFDGWWTLYPRKVAKGQARKAFSIARKKTGLETLTNGVRGYADKVRRDNIEERFIKHPATWLNGECWEDENSSEDPALPKSPYLTELSAWLAAKDEAERTGAQVPPKPKRKDYVEAA